MPKGAPPQEPTYGHAITAFLMQSITITLLMIYVCDYLDIERDHSGPASESNEFLAKLVGGYVLFLYISRIYFMGPAVIYEFLWCCNQAMLQVIVGLLTNRPMLIAVSCVGVVCDQCCWWLDLVLYLTTGKFISGVMKCLLKPGTHVIQLITTTHHWWFLPLCIYALRGYFPDNSFLASTVFTSISTFMSYYSCPKSVLIKLKQKDLNVTVITQKGKRYMEYYLNVNSGYEFWPDVPFSWFHKWNESSFAVYYAAIVFNGNFVLNLLPYLVMYITAEQVSTMLGVQPLQ